MKNRKKLFYLIFEIVIRELVRVPKAHNLNCTCQITQQKITVCRCCHVVWLKILMLGLNCEHICRKLHEHVGT